ncbi:MAG: GIY-YIG nuclease family protein, partial [Paludibacter sp.]|nr:GIY-YIG nuclease family protein [Paludibacter sp.]
VGGSNPSTPTFRKPYNFCRAFFYIYTSMFFTYIIYSIKLDIYYVGSTGNIEDRLIRHNSGRSKFTKPGLPWELKCISTHNSKSDAVRVDGN